MKVDPLARKGECSASGAGLGGGQVEGEAWPEHTGAERTAALVVKGVEIVQRTGQVASHLRRVSTSPQLKRERL